MLKTCTKCGIEKPVADFYYRKDQGRFRAECIVCFKQQVSSNKKTNTQLKQNSIRCDICGGDAFTGKRPQRSRLDRLYRCTSCQDARTRKLQTEHMRNALKGDKAESYKETRNKAKCEWEKRNPEARRARDLIKSVRKRLKQYDYNLERFQRPSTRELAKAIIALPPVCINCQTDQDLTIQHIKAVVDYPELALDPTNLTTLCRSCNTRSYYE